MMPKIMHTAIQFPLLYPFCSAMPPAYIANATLIAIATKAIRKYAKSMFLNLLVCIISVFFYLSSIFLNFHIFFLQ